MQNTTRAGTENILKEPYLAKKLEDPSFLFWQKLAFILQAIWEKYSLYFNLSYLFFTGYNLLPQGDPFQIGVFLFPFLPFFIFGIIKTRLLFKEQTKFIYTLLITTPITASLTTGPQSTSRNLITVIPISIICSIGILIFWRSVNIIWKIIFIIVLTVSFIFFLAVFYYHFPKDHAEGFQYGYKQMALFIKPKYKEFKQIIIDPRFGPGNIYSGLPSVYIPYNTNLDPQRILESKSNREGTFFDKYQIREISWERENIAEAILYIVPASNIPPAQSQLKKIHTISLPNLTPAFYLYIMEINE